MIPLLLAIGAVAASGLLSVEKEKTPEPKPARKKYSKAFILAAGKWLKENPPPEDWDGSKLEYAETEMPFTGDTRE